MLLKIWNKYKKIKDIVNSNIKTYLARIEYIIKEIIPKNEDECSLIKEKLEIIKNIIKINEIIEEDNKLYVIIDNNEEITSKFDNLILSEKSIIEKESILKGHGRPITKGDILDLIKMEESMCKISFERLEKDIKPGIASGFFCEIDKIEDFPFKYGLFTNYHVLNEYIKTFFKIDPILFTNDKIKIYNSDIFILQYPKCNDLSFSFSCGKILSLNSNRILHSASTDNGSSGSPIIRRCEEKYIIGLHYGGIKGEINFATLFDSIIYDINKNGINCI